MEPVNQPICFVNNVGALGDCIATIPAIKYAVENIWVDGKYRLMVQDVFKPLFYFVPEDKFAPLKKSALTFELFGEPFGYKILNDIVQVEGGRAVGSPSPEKMSLVDYASIKFLGRVLEEESKFYPILPLKHTDISKFGLSGKYACIVATTMHEVRVIEPKVIEAICAHLRSLDITPVFLGKTERDFNIAQYGTSFGSTFVADGINLVDKTSIMEAAKIMAGAMLVIGPDTGLLHLAAMTRTHIVCAYTTVKPQVRDLGPRCIAVVPDESKCRFCQSDKYLHNNDFNLCYTKELECVKDLTAAKFIGAINRLNLK